MMPWCNAQTVNCSKINTCNPPGGHIKYWYNIYVFMWDSTDMNKTHLERCGPSQSRSAAERPQWVSRRGDLAVSRAHRCPCTRQRETIKQRRIHDSKSRTGSSVSSWVRAEPRSHERFCPCPGGETCWKHLRLGIHPGNIRAVCCNTTYRKRQAQHAAIKVQKKKNMKNEAQTQLRLSWHDVSIKPVIIS